MKENLKQIAKKPKVLFVGASKINSKIIKRTDFSLYDVFITNRTQSKGIEFAKKHQAPFVPWSHLDNWDYFDALILGTKSHRHLVGKKDQIQSQKLVIDLGVPRNACPKMGMNPKIKLLNIDQINKLVRGKSHTHLLKVNELERAICTKTLRQKEIFQMRNQWIKSTSAVS